MMSRTASFGVPLVLTLAAVCSKLIVTPFYRAPYL